MVAPSRGLAPCSSPLAMQRCAQRLAHQASRFSAPVIRGRSLSRESFLVSNPYDGARSFTTPTLVCHARATKEKGSVPVDSADAKVCGRGARCNVGHAMCVLHGVTGGGSGHVGKHGAPASPLLPACSSQHHLHNTPTSSNEYRP